jgi:hypothetical protein
MTKPNPDYVPNPQAKDGTISLPARTAEVHGVQLRYEPLPHKNTLGFWTRADDWASWEFTVTKPGTFAVEVLQGCGGGQGGSEVRLAVGEQVLTFTVEDTGGFQNFKARAVGTLKADKAGALHADRQAEDEGGRRGDGPALGDAATDEVNGRGARRQVRAPRRFPPIRHTESRFFRRVTGAWCRCGRGRC